MLIVFQNSFAYETDEDQSPDNLIGAIWSQVHKARRAADDLINIDALDYNGEPMGTGHGEPTKHSREVLNWLSIRRGDYPLQNLSRLTVPELESILRSLLAK